MSIRPCLHFIFCVAALTAAVSAQSAVRWEPSLDAALARAKTEGRPLLITMHTSTEIACRRMLGDIYTDPDVIAVLDEFVVLPTCFDAHAEEERTIGGKAVKVSPLFGSVDCKTLMASEAAVRARYFDKNEVKVPQHVFVGDDGEIFSSKIYELKKEAFIELLNNALLQYGDKAADGMDVVTQTFLKTVKQGSMKDKRKAVKGILDMQNERKLDILCIAVESVKKENEKGECVRAFGSDRYSSAGARVVKWLRDPSEYVRHCAVVSLEEMKATEALADLLRLYEKESDKEFKKDILRALGPCGGGDAAAKKILLAHVDDRREDNRVAAYLSLGYYLRDEDVQAVLKQRYQKEGKTMTAKTAIIWAFTYAGDESLIPQLHDLVAKESNQQIEYLAAAAELAMRTGQGVAPDAPLGEHIKLHNALGVILGKDKILRNRHKYYKGDD